MQYKDYYRILDIDEDATEAEIKAAYRKLARRYHPDVSRLKDAEERFKEVAEAYETLKDPCKRTRYDRFGPCSGPPPDWERQFREFFACDENPARCTLDDLLAMFKGGAARNAANESAAHGRDIALCAQITLEQAAAGAELDLEIPRAGAADRKIRSVRVRIPKGARHGQVLRVAAAGANGEPGGDLLVTIALRPHPLFRVAGHDLTLDVPLTPSEAALGTTLEIPTLQGRVRLRIPPGTQSSQRLRIAGRGLPKPDGGAGDLYAQMQIVTPSVLSERERELYAELARACSFEPRAHFA